MSDWKESKTIVGEEEGSERQVVAYVAKDDRVGLHVHDLKRGKEYEFHAWVTAEFKDKLIVALIEHLYGGAPVLRERLRRVDEGKWNCLRASSRMERIQNDRGSGEFSSQTGVGLCGRG